jgi:hypothetical protein
MFVSLNLNAQNNRLCNAVEKENFRQVEKMIRKEILQRKYGTEVKNGSATYTTYSSAYDDLVTQLMQNECVALTAWDKCQAKILPYPSFATIGVIFKTPNKAEEMIFHIREGHSSRLKQSVNSRERLYYLSMEKGNGFVQHQIELCENEPQMTNDTLPPQKVEYKALSNTQKFNDTLTYANLLGKYVCIGCNDTLTLKEAGNPAHSIIMTHTARNVEKYTFPIVSKGKIKQIGVYSPWHIQIVGVQILKNGDLEAHFAGSYSFDEAATIKLTYRKISNE